MSNQTIALLLGGVLAAVLLGVSGSLQKSANVAGIGTGPYLVLTGVAVVVVGLVAMAVQRDLTVNWRSGGLTLAFGGLWAVATGCIAVAFGRFQGNAAQIVPLYNMNTLVAVGIGLWLFGEWKQVSVPKALLAALLICVGGWLASTARLPAEEAKPLAAETLATPGSATADAAQPR